MNTQKIVLPFHKTQTTLPDSKNLSRSNLSKLTTCCYFSHGYFSHVTLHGQIHMHRSKIKPMRLALWNANSLAQHKFELELFLKQQQIDILLISETHFTDKNYLKIHGYNFYHTQHPSGKAQGGTGIIIKSSIKHYELPSYQKDYLQATSVAVEDRHGTSLSSILPSQTLDCKRELRQPI